MKYSIITPNYNGFSLMSRYFESLEKQTYKDFEVIIVDDCSTDSSMERLRDYASKSSLRITLLSSSKNMGPGNARNLGMEVAKGDWITFIDNDDFADDSFFETIDSYIAKTEANCYIYDYLIRRTNAELYGSSLYNGSEGYVELAEAITYTRNHAFGKVYKRKNVMEASIKYPMIRRCEDVAFVCQALIACKTVFYIHKPLYNYVQRKVSLSNNGNMGETDMIKAFTILEENVDKKYSAELQSKSVTDLLYGVVLMMCKSRSTKSSIVNYINQYETKYPRWTESRIISSIGTFKRLFLLFTRKRNVTCLRLLASIHSFCIQ